MIMKPKPYNFTPEQEEQIAAADRMSARAQIWECGVGEFLKTHSPCTLEIAVAASVLEDAVKLRDESHRIRAAAHTGPAPVARKRRPRKKASK